MDVSIVIINYNTKVLLADAIASVKDKTKNIDYEIIVVDNASSDNTVNYIKENFVDVKIIASNENLGFGKANNLGAKIATGKYLLLLNSDTLMVNNAIKILFDFLEKNEEKKIGIVGGNLYTRNMKENFSYSTYLPTLKTHLFYRLYLSNFLSRDNFNRTAQSKKVGQIIGADLMISKQLFDKIGGFDPFYFMYVEDTDLQRRITDLGYHIYSVPDAKIIHLQGASSLSYQKLKWEIDGYKHYFKKFYNNEGLEKYIMIEKLSMRIRKIRYFLNGNKSYINVINQILKNL